MHRRASSTSTTCSINAVAAIGCNWCNSRLIFALLLPTSSVCARQFRVGPSAHIPSFCFDTSHLDTGQTPAIQTHWTKQHDKTLTYLQA